MYRPRQVIALIALLFVPSAHRTYTNKTNRLVKVQATKEF